MQYMLVCPLLTIKTVEFTFVLRYSHLSSELFGLRYRLFLKSSLLYELPEVVDEDMQDFLDSLEEELDEAEDELKYIKIYIF